MCARAVRESESQSATTEELRHCEEARSKVERSETLDWGAVVERVGSQS